jgi:hypothetical protein
MFFVENIASTNFGGPLGPQWKMEGPLELSTAAWLGPARASKTGDAYESGAVVLSPPLQANRAYVIEASVMVHQGGDDVVLELFVADDTGGHELAWVLKGVQAKVVLPDGKVAWEAQQVTEPPETVTVSLRLNRDAAIVDMGGQRIWAGENQLSGEKARTVGVRFRQRGASKGHLPHPPVVQSLRVARAPEK